MAIIEANSIFFDVDGTLVDARKDIANAMNFALKSMGKKTLPDETIVSYVGTGVKYLIKNSLDTDDPEAIDRGTKLYTEYYIAHAADEARLYPNAVDILEYFKGKRKFILTNRYTAFTEPVLKGLGIRGYFEEIIAGDDEACIKPSACMLDRVVPRLRIDKERSLIVGDMDVDIMIGKNAGVRTCWVTHGLGKIEEIKHLKPDYIIEDLIELKEIVK